MHKFWALFKILLINYFGFSISQIKSEQNRSKYLKKLGLGLLIIIGLTPTVVLYVKLLLQGFDLLAPVGQEGAILTLGIVMVSSIIFVFGIFYIISFLYFADDAQNLLALPLSGWQVLGARFSIVLLYEYLGELLFLLPPLIIYGIKGEVSIIYWIYALLAFLLTPLLPLALAAIPTIVVMRFANLSRRKDLFKIVGGIFVIVLAVSYQLMVQKSGPNTMDPAFIQNILTDRSGIMNLISRVFPSTRYLGLALINTGNMDGLVNILIFTGYSLAAMAITWLVGDKLYYKGLIGSGETSAKRKKLSRSDYKRLGKGSPAVWVYFKKEVRVLLRTPTYFINSVMANLLVPVLITVPFLIHSNNEEASVPWDMLINGPKGQTILMVAVIGIVIFLAGSNAVTATSLSREGKQFFISKYIPLSYQEQIKAKLFSAYIFGISGTVLMIIAARILMPIDIKIIGMLLGVGMVAIMPVIEAGLIIDILQPKLQWENEQQAFKQNLNVLISMVVSILLGGIILYLVVRFIHSPVWAALFMLLCFGLAALILYYWLMTWGVQRYHNLEG